MNDKKKNVRYKRKPKNDLVIFILESLKEVSLTTLDIFNLTLSGHRYVYSKTQNNLEKSSTYRHKILNNKFNKLKEKRRIHNLLYQLQKQGFISKKSAGKETKWTATNSGCKKFLAKDIIYLPKNNFQSQQSENLIAVIFDIPEKDRELRDWLREALVNMNFKLLQNSVWIGKRKLPMEFMKILKDLCLLPRYVKILAISNEDSIDS